MKVKSSLLALLAMLVCLSLAVPLLPQDKAKDQGKEKQGKADIPKPLSKGAQERQKNALRQELDRPFKKWLDEEVFYVITGEERAAFKQLQNAEEREQFIEQFWLRRDPTPDTNENEYREEHYRRIAYANEHFASGIPGWKADRGRIYITFGPPDEKEEHPSGGSYFRPSEEGGGSTSTFPFEKWRYRYIEGIGNDINIEFVDPTMSGEYRISIDPQEKDALLHVPNAGLTLMEELGLSNKTDRVINQDGTGMARGGLSERLTPFARLDQLHKLMKPPEVKFKDLLAVVDSKITYNLFPFKVRTDYVKITSENSLSALTVQMAVKDMTFQNKEGIQHALVNIFGRITTFGGRTAQTFEDVVKVDVPADQLPQYLGQQRVYWQSIPLKPGTYKLSMVVKDINGGNMGTYNVALRVPRFDDETLSASSLILADNIQKVASKDIGKGQFVIGATKVRPKVDEKFGPSDRLGIYMQVYNLQTDEKTHKPNATVEYTLLRDDKQVWQHSETSAQIEGASQQMTLEKMLPLDNMQPGRYKLVVKVTDELGKMTITPSATFTVQ